MMTQHQFKIVLNMNTMTLRVQKAFNNLNSEFTDKVESVNYQTYDENYQWLGANSANFPLGYLNHSKFNIYELRRDWLPFENESI